MSKGDRNNQLTSVEDLVISNIMFSELKKEKIPGKADDKKALTYDRINFSYKNSDGTIGDLIIPTTRVFSFGVQQNTDQKTGEPSGYQMSLCLWSKNGATQEEKAWTDKFNEVCSYIKQQLLDNKEEYEFYELEEPHLKKINPLYWKKEKGKVVEGTGPTLYIKLLESKKHNKIMTMFFDKNGDPIDPLTLQGKYCNCQGAIKFESIYHSGDKYSLQLKLYECADVEMIDLGMKPLLRRNNKPVSSLMTGNSKNLNDIANEVEKEKKKKDDDAGSLNGDEEPPKPKEPAVVKKKIVKKAQK